MGETEHRKERLMQGQSLIYDRTVWHNIKYYKAIAYYLQLAGLEVEESFMPEWLGKSEIDIYLPALHLGIEYDGQAWHKSGKKDLKKDLLCLANGVGLIRVRERKCPHISGIGPCYNLPDTKESSLDAAIKFVFETLQEEYDVNIPSEVHVDVASNQIKIYELIELRDKANSLGILQPQLAKETIIRTVSSRQKWYIKN